MSFPQYRVRRATLDDLRPLAALWGTMNFAVDELARRITDFHVVESAQGVLLGAAGLQAAERQGLVHSEGFTDFALADTLRPLLWERLQAVARNQGLLRLWTQEQAPFWSHCGLVKADAEALEKLPAPWRALPSAWRTLKLRDDLDTIVSADQAFAVFVESERQQTARTLRRAKVLKSVMVFLSFLFLALVLGATLYLLWRSRQPHGYKG
jgi:N-acetylglutamate synthase-like GNAT family acetyltransferase